MRGHAGPRVGPRTRVHAGARADHACASSPATCPTAGVLRSFDQFANLVLESTVERVFVGEQFGDIPMGLQLIRGENVVLLGEIDPSMPAPVGFTQADPADILQAQRAEKQQNKLKATIRCVGQGSHTTPCGPAQCAA